MYCNVAISSLQTSSSVRTSTAGYYCLLHVLAGLAVALRASLKPVLECLPGPYLQEAKQYVTLATGPDLHKVLSLYRWEGRGT
jgi:hypothetical protein